MVAWNINLTKCKMNWTRIPRQIPFINTTIEGRAKCANGDRRFDAVFTRLVSVELNWPNDDVAHYIQIHDNPLSNVFLLLPESADAPILRVPEGDDERQFQCKLLDSIRDHFAEFVHGNIRLLHGAFKVVDPRPQWFPPFELLHGE